MSLSNLNSCNNELLFIDHLNCNVLDCVCGNAQLLIGATGASSIWIGGATTPVYINNNLFQGETGSTGLRGATGPTGATGAKGDTGLNGGTTGLNVLFTGNTFDSNGVNFNGNVATTVQGSVATITISSNGHQQVNGGGVFTSTFTMGVAFRPSVTRFGVIQCRNNSNFQFGSAQIATSGVVTLGVSIDVGTVALVPFAQGDNGIYDSTVVYEL